MKRVELLGLSAVTAALIMTGCSSDDNNGGATPPAEISAAMEMNVTSAKNAMYAIKDGGASPAARRAARLAAAAKRAAKFPAPGGSDNTSYTYECDISGNYSYTYTYKYTGDPWGGTGESWSEEYSGNYTYNHCVDNYSSSITIDGVSEPVNQSTYNGTYSYNSHYEYNADINISKDSYSSSDNYTDAIENNETLTSRVYSYHASSSGTSELEGEGWSGSADATYKYSEARNGGYSREDTNSTGSVRYGYKYTYGNQTYSEEGVQDYSSGTYTENGFYTNYDLNPSSGEYELDYGYNYDHLTFTYSEAGDDSNVTVNGGYGDECLGGTVNFATASVVQENQVDYLDGDDNTGYNVLPHAGAVTMTGTSSASVAFTVYDTNHTSALLNVGGSDINVTRWSDLAVQNCVY